MKKYVWTWYTFADGYRMCVRSLSKVEKANAIAAHGAIVATSKERAWLTESCSNVKSHKSNNREQLKTH